MQRTTVDKETMLVNTKDAPGEHHSTPSSLFGLEKTYSQGNSRDQKNGWDREGDVAEAARRKSGEAGSRR
jgi:hypothetical protein